MASYTSMYLRTTDSTSSSTATWSLWNAATSTTTDVYCRDWNRVLITIDTTTDSSSGAVWCYWNNGQVIYEEAVAATARTSEERTTDWARGYGESYREQERLYHERRARRVAQEAAESAIRIAAEEKAEALLIRMLDDHQQAEYKEKHVFHLYTRDGKKYRVERGRSGNVKLLDETDQVEASFCIHHKEYLPTSDLMLHQKLLLETDEEQFLTIANRTDRRVA